MNKDDYVVECSEVVGDVPPLPHCVMGNFAYNFLRTGVRLQKTLEQVREEPLLRRTMGMLNAGIGINKATNVYTEGPDGEPIYDFTLLDKALDVMVGPRSVPFFGISFMPEALSDSLPPEESADLKDIPPEARTTGGGTALTMPQMRPSQCPPKDYDRWYDLVRTVVTHCVERHGKDDVSRWYWDFWNEPDLMRYYWLGSVEELMMTYDHAAAAVKDALPTARVGGCGPANPTHPIFKEFLEHCTAGTNHRTGQTGSPLDFITFHLKGGPTGRLGNFTDPWEATNYEVRPPSFEHMINITREALEIIAAVPGTQGLPCFLTECDIDWGTGTSIYANPNMHYRNSEYFPAFECAMVKRMLDLRAQFPANPIQGCFLDTFYITGSRIFEGQRTLITGECIDKPILNGLRLLGRLGSSRLAVVESEEGGTEVLAAKDQTGAIQVMAVNFHEDFDYADEHRVSVQLKGLADGPCRCRHWRIDRDHSNAYTVWLEMGRPIVPDDEQLAAIQARQGLELCEPEFDLTVENGRASLETTLPPHAVSLWEITRP